MKRIGNSMQTADAFIWKGMSGLETKALGASVGSEKLYVNLDIVPVGKYSAKYHSHTRQEEFFYILSGKGTLHLNGETLLVQAGDFLAKPAGKEIAHTFYNSGEAPLHILDIGTVEAEDICHYPMEDVYLHKKDGVSKAYQGEVLLENWSSEPK